MKQENGQHAWQQFMSQYEEADSQAEEEEESDNSEAKRQRINIQVQETAQYTPQFIGEPSSALE